jgi:hypothetical protein
VSWNCQEMSPKTMLGRFNGFVKCVILRVSEARDLGDVDRYQFYEAMKVYCAAPPDVLRVDEKNLREYGVMNCCGVVITTNHKSDGIYLPADDRRTYVAWSELSLEDFAGDYWRFRCELSRWRDSRYMDPGWIGRGGANGSGRRLQGAAIHRRGDPVGRSLVSVVSHQLPRSRTDAPRPRRRGRPHIPISSRSPNTGAMNNPIVS